jgi:hypothetical protein
VLTEEPNVQPIHPMMHCEADLFLQEGQPVTAVGFGQWEPGDPELDTSGGTKHSATSSVFSAESSASLELGLFASNSWTPGDPAQGDSGGPLLVQLPDLTWRVAGVALTNFHNYASVWPHMAWIATDPNVDISEVLPCHSVDGEWTGGPTCKGFMLDPGAAEGAWARAPMACYHTSVSPVLNSCGMMVKSDDEHVPTGGLSAEPASPPVVGGDGADGPEDRGAREAQASGGCSVAPADGPAGRRTLPLCAASGLLLLASRTRRRGAR